MNFNEMKTFVRNQADTDSTDAPDANLIVYARAAFNDIRRRVGAWVDNSTSETLTTTADQDNYALSSTSSFSVGNIEYVSAVVGPTESLRFVTWGVYLEMLDGPDITYSTTEATHWTVRNGELYLWPTPSAATAYTVYGYRKFTTTWPATNPASRPDLPEEFDEAICWYMLARYFQSQEDLELSATYMADYERSISRFIAAQMRQAQPHIRKFGGGRNYTPSYAAWVRRNTEG